MAFIDFKTSFAIRMADLNLHNGKNAYLVELQPGYTIEDLTKCLSPHVSGLSFKFNPAFASPVCKLLGTSIDCTRTIKSTEITFTKCTIPCTVAGKPTHIIFGDTMPLAASVGIEGTDLITRFDTLVEVDYNTKGTVVYVPAFTVQLGGMV